MTSPLDCKVCAHPVRTHTIPKFMQLAKLCRDCDCTGYVPAWKPGET